jgi:hypothetical protein
MLSHGMAKSVVDMLRGLSAASGLSPSRFGALLPDTVGAAAADRLQAAGRAAASAHTTEGERAASNALADAVQAVGLDGWPRFVAEVEYKAADRANTAAIEQNRQSSNVPKDATTSVGSAKPIQLAQAEGREDIDPEEFLDPMAAVRVAQYSAARNILRTLEPDNRQLWSLTSPDFTPSQAAVDALDAQVAAAQARVAAAAQRTEAAIQTALASTDAGTRFEGETAKLLQKSGEEVTGFQVEFGSNASRGEIDIETREAVIEVTLARRGKLGQVQKLVGRSQMNPSGEPVIMYAPNYQWTAGKAASAAGVTVVRTPEDRVRALKSLGVR